MFPRNTDYKYSDGRIFLLRLDESTSISKEEAIQYVGGKKDFYSRDIHLECNIQPGTYGVFAEIDWCQEGKAAQQEFVITCYGPSKVYFTNATKNFTKEAILSATLLNIMKQGNSVEANSLDEAPDCHFVEVSTDFGYSAYVVNNQEANITYEEDAEFPEFEGV